MLRKSKYKNLDKWRKTKIIQRRRYRKQTGAGMFLSRSWTSEEDKKVLTSTLSDRDLSQEIKRSVGAIQTRRVRLKNTNQVTEEGGEKS